MRHSWLRPLRQIPGPVGPLEALLDAPAGEPRAAVVFAHPLPTHGGTMHTKVVFQSAKALTRIGCVVLRFNFRGVGMSAGTWDNGRGELDDYKAALDVHGRRPIPGLETMGRWLFVRLATSRRRSAPTTSACAR